MHEDIVADMHFLQKYGRNFLKSLPYADLGTGVLKTFGHEGRNGKTHSDLLPVTGVALAVQNTGLDDPCLTQCQSSVVYRNPQRLNDPDVGSFKKPAKGVRQDPVLKNPSGQENSPDSGLFPGPENPVPKPQRQGPVK